MTSSSDASLMLQYRDRRDAGVRLAAELGKLELSSPVVLGLPRGGVVVAAEVAAALSAPLDVLVVRKLGVPWHPELGMGAIAEGGVVVVNQDVVSLSGVSEEEIAEVRVREEAELERRATLYRRGHPAVPLEGTTAVLVDDGLATGYTARAAVAAARAKKAMRVVLAVPVGSQEAVRNLSKLADLVVCPLKPADFYAVGQFYSYFDQTSDDEVIKLLDRR